MNCPMQCPLNCAGCTVSATRVCGEILMYIVPQSRCSINNSNDEQEVRRLQRSVFPLTHWKASGPRILHPAYMGIFFFFFNASTQDPDPRDSYLVKPTQGLASND